MSEVLQWYIICALADPFHLIIHILFSKSHKILKVLLSDILEVALGSTNKHFWHHGVS
jgi:hypothetical protein